MAEKLIAKIFPIVFKPYSGLFSATSHNSLPLFSLSITTNALRLKILGIPVGSIKVKDIISFKSIHNESVGVQKVEYGVVIKYKRKNKIEETVFIPYTKNKLNILLDALKKAFKK